MANSNVHFEFYSVLHFWFKYSLGNPIHEVDRKSGFKTPDQMSAVLINDTVRDWCITYMHAFS